MVDSARVVGMENQIGGPLARGLIGAAMAVAAAMNAGCSSLPGLSMQAKTPEQQVAARSEARAHALMKKDYRAVYDFMTPAYRQALGYEQYLAGHPARVDLKKAKVLKVTCADSTSCQVMSQWTYIANAGPKGVNVGEVTSVVPEKWIKVEGRWWYYEGKR